MIGMKTKTIILTVLIIIIAGLGIYLTIKHSQQQSATPGQQVGSSSPAQTSPSSPASPASPSSPSRSSAPQEVIGKSVQGRDITAYHYGTGSTDILFVGGIHGGYEWNSSLVAYQLMDYLAANPSVIPANERITVIPALNPDGLAKVVGHDGRFTASDVSPSQSTQVAGRFNANNVDLNRNFDCKWQASGIWQNKTVSGGTSAFSEPESQAIQAYIGANKPAAAIVWYSAAGGVYASACTGPTLPATTSLAKAFAVASGYPFYEQFDAYALTGDMVNWFASQNIPAVSVLLTNHTDTEWSMNLAGIQAVFERYAK